MTIYELFDTSEGRVDRARKDFNAARTTMVAAKTYGNAAQIADAVATFLDRSAGYAAACRTHANIVDDIAIAAPGQPIGR